MSSLCEICKSNPAGADGAACQVCSGFAAINLIATTICRSENPEIIVALRCMVNITSNTAQSDGDVISIIAQECQTAEVDLSSVMKIIQDGLATFNGALKDNHAAKRGVSDVQKHMDRMMQFDVTPGAE